MCFLWTLLWKFHFFINWPLEFPCSSIPLEIPCSPHPCHLFGLDFFWNSPLLLVCFHIELGSHLKQVTTVLLSSSRAGSSIFKTANIGRLTFLLPFTRQEIHEKSTLYFTFKIINIHNRSCRKFFLPLLNPLFSLQQLYRFSTGPAQARKTVCSHQNLFFKIKDWMILFELEGILKNNLRLFKFDSKRHYLCTIVP